MTQTVVSLNIRGRNRFELRVAEAGERALHGLSIDTVQVNIGLRCNLACHHCHVESSPTRREEMSWNTMQLALEAAHASGAKTVDITGGAPEMHPHFRQFVTAARTMGKRVIVRTNLTILLEAGYENLPLFFKEQRVHLIASLPCYLENNVDRQRGRGVHHESIQSLRELNRIGYGIEPDLPLDLVYNPGGPSLPPEQGALEESYRRELAERFGIRFTRLITITNLPIGRFLHDLERQGKDRQYMDLVVRSFNPATLPGLMCRHQLHVGWDGRLYDCDFNFALGLFAHATTCGHVRDFDPDAYLRRPIVTGPHCFGCTAGHGSSCGGALA
jgi:radical SAM/Cys-rich protein